MSVRITTLSENTAGGDPANLNWFFRAEYALSCLVQVDGQTILFDTGLDTAAVYNARLLGIDPGSIETIVLSHGHEDHVGGLRDVLRWAGSTDVVAHPDVWQVKYGQLGDKQRYVGIPFQREELEALGARFNLDREPVRLGERVWTTGEVPIVTDYEKIDAALMVKEDGVLKPDPVMDDLSLVVQTDKGLVVILGCAHRGMVNHLLHAQKVTGEERIHAVLGGTHLESASDEQLDKTVAVLKSMKIDILGACHCTGFKALCRLAQEFGDAFILNNAGSILEI